MGGLRNEWVNIIVRILDEIILLSHAICHMEAI